MLTTVYVITRKPQSLLDVLLIVRCSREACSPAVLRDRPALMGSVPPMERDNGFDLLWRPPDGPRRDAALHRPRRLHPDGPGGDAEGADHHKPECEARRRSPCED